MRRHVLVIVSLVGFILSMVLFLGIMMDKIGLE